MALALAAGPAYNLRFHVGPLPSTVLEVLLLLAIGLGAHAHWRELPWRNPYTIPAALLLAGAGIDTVFTASDHVKALGIWRAYFLEPMAAGLVIAALARRRERARLLLAGLGCAGLVVAVANLVVDGVALATHSFNQVTPQVAIFQTNNAVALYLEPLAAVALAIALHSEVRRERLAAGAGFGLFALAILLSYSRAGWATLIVLAMVVAVFHRRRWLVLGAALVLVAAAVAGSHQVRHRIAVEFEPDNQNNTLNLRRRLWASTLNLLAHRPLVGGGLNGFRSAVARYRVDGYAENLIYPHNLVLNFWAETGLVGLAGILLALVQGVRTCRRGLAAGPWARSLAIGLLGALAAIVVHGMVDVPYFKNDLAVAFWALLAIQLGSLTLPERG